MRSLPMSFTILVILGALLTGRTVSAAPSAADSRPFKVSVIGAPSAWALLAFMRDGRRLATFDGDGGLRTWNAADGQLLTAARVDLPKARGHNAVWRLTPDDQVLTVDDGEHPELLRIEVPSGRIAARDRLPARASSVSISPDGTRIALADDAGNAIRIVDARTRQVQRTLKGPPRTDRFLSMAFSQDGQALTAACQGYADIFVTVWDIADGRQVRSVNVGQGSGYALAAGNRRAVMSGKRVRLVDLAGGNTVWEAKLGRITDPGSVSTEVSPIMAGDRGVLLALPDRRAATFLSLADGGLSKEIPLPDYPRPEFTLSPDGRTLVVTASGEPTTTWDVETGAQLARIGTLLDGGGSITGPAAVVTPDLRLGLAGLQDGTIVVWDLVRGRLAQRLAGPKGFVNRLRVTPDGRYAVAAIASPDRRRTTFRWWNLDSGELLRAIEITGDHGDVALLADGRRAIFTDNDRGVKLWDLQTGRPLRAFETRGVRTDPSPGFFLSPDDRLLILNEDTADGRPKTVRIFDAETGRQRRSLPGEVWGVNAIYPNNETVVLHRTFETGRGSHLGLWDLATGSLRRKLSADGEVDRILQTSPDTLLVTTSEGGKLHAEAMDLVSGRARRIPEVDPDLLWPIGVRDGRLVSSYDAGQLTMSGRDGTSASVRFYTFADGEWLAMTAEGFFNGSEKAARRLSVVRGVEATSIDQVFQSLYRPDLVREKLAGDPRGLVREAAAQVDLPRALASGQPPEPRLAALGPAGERQEVEAELRERGGGLGRVEWRVNGVTAAVEPPQSDLGQPGESRRLRRSFALEPGLNLIEVVAYNRAGLVASAPAQVSVVRAAAAAPPRLFVLAVGLDDYADAQFKLAHSVADAEATAKVLSEAGQGLYDRVNVTVLRNKDAVPSKLEAAFDRLAREVAPSDTFAFFIAGHGKTIDARYYFIPQTFSAAVARASAARATLDAGRAAEAALRAAVTAQGIPQDQWQAWFARVPARRSLLLFDTCESGTLIGGDRETQALERGAAGDRLAQATGRTIITASKGDAEAIEGYRGHGLFTYNVIEAFERADTDGNGRIEVAELAAYVHARVSSLSESVFKLRQEPQVRIAGHYSLARRVEPRQARWAPDDTPTTATHTVTQTADLQVAPGVGAPVVRRLATSTPITVLRNVGGWVLVASGGKPLGYIPASELAPLR